MSATAISGPLPTEKVSAVNVRPCAVRDLMGKSKALTTAKASDGSGLIALNMGSFLLPRHHFINAARLGISWFPVAAVDFRVISEIY